MGVCWYNKARILKIVTYYYRFHLSGVFPGLQGAEFNRWNRDYLLLKFYTASCCQYIFVLQVEWAATAKSWRALWSVWLFSLYLVFSGASSRVYDLVLFQESTAAGLIKNGNVVGDVAHNRFERNAVRIVLQPAVSVWVRTAFLCSWLEKVLSLCLRVLYDRQQIYQRAKMLFWIFNKYGPPVLLPTWVWWKIWWKITK